MSGGRPAALGALLVSLAVVGATDARAAESRRCGDMGTSLPDYYDVRATGTTCAPAKRVVRAWAQELGGRCATVFDPCTVRRHRCAGRRSQRRIEGTKTFRVTCRRGERRVTWYIRPTA